MRFQNIAVLGGMIFSCIFQLVVAEVLPYPEPGNHNLLAADLFHTIVESKSAENILFSPIPIETALTMSFAGADGKTAEDLRQALRLGKEDDTTRITENYVKFLKTLITPNNEDAKISQPELFVANRIYVSDKLKISSDFSKKAEENFNILAENVNFDEADLTTKKINDFVKEYTHDKINNLLQLDEINSDSKIIYVNGLYFKGKWKYGFNEKYTKKADFQYNENEKTQVEMMHIKGTFNYVNLPELEACVLELPYNYSGLNMLFVLPYKVDGLKNLEKKVKDLEFNFILSRLAPKEVCAYIPKFQIEHAIDLEPALEKIGLPIIFSEKAEFPAMLVDPPAGQYISIFKQKALLEIDELGVESAGDLGAAEECGKDSVPFKADHPFIFAVRSSSAVYFAGHVAKL